MTLMSLKGLGEGWGESGRREKKNDFPIAKEVIDKTMTS